MKLWNPFRREPKAVAAPSTTSTQERTDESASPAPPKSSQFELPKQRATRLLPEYEQQTVTNPQDPEGWFSKAEALATLERHNEALAAYEQTLALDPGRPLALRGKAAALRSLDQKDAALETIERSLAIDPNIALSWRTKGAILRDFSRHEEALSCYEKGLSIDPKDATLWCNKGNTLRALHRVDEAMQAYHQASAGHPIATLNQGVGDARKASSKLWEAMQVGEHLVMRLRREIRFDQTWTETVPEPPATIDGERLAMSVRSIEDLEAWLALYGFEFRKQVTGSTTLTGRNYEHIDHFETSVWFKSCRLGKWDTNGDQNAWFVPEPKPDDAETHARQRDGWNRLTELLASRAMNHLPLTLARALAMEKVHGHRLLRKMGNSIRDWNACAACGEALYAGMYGDTNFYRINLANPERELILCTSCGKQLQAEQKP